jgi:hypothetical protein
MKRLTAAALAAFVLAQPAPAAPVDPERAAVIAAVQQFFDGMAANDPKLMGEVLMAEGMTASVRPGSDGSTVARFTPQRQFLERTGGDKYLEQMWDPVVSRRGALAVLWAPYEFQRNGKTTHCGIDVFNLVKTEGRWEIAGGSWTVEPDGCPELKAKSKR